MSSVTRNRKLYGNPQVYSADRRKKITEEIKGENQRFYRDHDPRIDGDNGYHCGRVNPLIEDER